MNRICFSENCGGEPYKAFPFMSDGKPAGDALWGMTLRAAGSMRFRWNEKNENRIKLLSEIAGHYGNKTPVPVQLDHTKIVYDVSEVHDTDGKIGDGIITENAGLMPVVTVADCVPIFLYSLETGLFGVVHSGWKGTGIAGEAVKMMKMRGTDPGKICAAVGPHIRDCCYVVNKERADYFAREFCADCVRKIEAGEKLCRGAPAKWDNGSGPLYRLSLLKANLAVLEKAGIKEQNITVAEDCTCCNSVFGSNRRETSSGIEFTVQAAFIVRGVYE